MVRRIGIPLFVCALGGSAAACSGSNSGPSPLASCKTTSAVATHITLAVGQYVSLDPATDSGCVLFPANASSTNQAEYLLVPQSATGDTAQSSRAVRCPPPACLRPSVSPGPPHPEPQRSRSTPTAVGWRAVRPRQADGRRSRPPLASRRRPRRRSPPVRHSWGASAPSPCARTSCAAGRAGRLPG